MRAVLIHAPRDIRVEEVAAPALRGDTDAIVRVVAACVCGSDLWRYRGVIPVGRPQRIGHEFVGVVEQVGSAVTALTPGDFVIAPFYFCDGTCINCRNGVSSACLRLGLWGGRDGSGAFTEGAQGEAVRVPLAEATLTVVPQPEPELIPGLLSLSDVMGTGHHAAVSAGVQPGSTVAVIGDGAVGLCAIIAARRLGAARVVALSRHPDRQRLAREFGADEVIEARGPQAVAAVHELFDGVGPDCVLECVGTAESLQQALESVRPGGMVGFVGVPTEPGASVLEIMFRRNAGLRGGVAPVRDYIAELLPDVLARRIEPGRVFDLELPLAQAAEAYAAMDERRAVKVLLRP